MTTTPASPPAVDWERRAFNAVSTLPADPRRRTDMAYGYLSEAVRGGLDLTDLRAVVRGLERGMTA